MVKNSQIDNFLNLFQNIIDILPYFVMVVDEDHEIIIINDNVKKALEHEKGPIIGSYCPRLIHGTDEPFPGCPLEESIVQGGAVTKELYDPFYGKWITSAIYPLLYKSKNDKRLYLHIVYDISELKKAEETILEQNLFLTSILDSLSQPFYVIDADDYTIKLANSAANFGELNDKSKCYRLTHKSSKPCNSKKHPCPVQEIKKTRKPFTVEHIHYPKDGEPVEYEVQGYPIFGENGRITHIIEYTFDITDRKRAREKLFNTQVSLEEKSRNLNEKNIALKVLLEHLGEEKKDIKKNYITNIKTLIVPYLDKLSNSSLNESQKTLIEIVTTNISEVTHDFAKKLMDDTLNLTPVETRVANMVKNYKTAKEIAELMHISENTVKAHFSNIRSKLGIKNKKINLRYHLQSLLKE